MSNQFFVRDAMEESVFVDRSPPNVRIFCFLRENRHFPKKIPKASASVNREVHQHTECKKKHNRAPNRVPIRQILAARRGVAYSWEGGVSHHGFGHGLAHLKGDQPRRRGRRCLHRLAEGCAAALGAPASTLSAWRLHWCWCATSHHLPRDSST